MNTITSNSKSEIGLELMEWYVKEGFMKSSKKDVDIYVLHLMCKYNPEYFQKDLYEISTELKITQSKVKSYLSEVQIRYQHLTVEKILEYLIGTILSGAYTMENEGKKICVQVNSPIVVEYLRYKLNDMSIVNDYSFNNSIVVLPFEKFIDLADSINSETNDQSSIFKKLDNFIESKRKELLFEGIVEILEGDTIGGSFKNLVVFALKNREQLKRMGSSLINSYFFNYQSNIKIGQ